MDKKIQYTAIVLDDDSKRLLQWYVNGYMPLLNGVNIPGFTWYGDHMTINYGPEKIGIDDDYIIALKIDAIGYYDNALAARVCNMVRYDNYTPHITIATQNGGAPSSATLIRDWKPLPSGVLILTGKKKEF